MVQKDRRNSWLTNIPEKTLSGVVDDVRQLRASGMTDLEIYKRYHNKANIGDVSPSDLESFKILDAVMGGVKGKIPF